MAGRPAPGRGGGLTGLHYALISFVIVSVIALVFAVIELTRVSDAEARATRAENQTANFGPPIPYYADEATASGRKTFAVVAEDLKRIGKIVNGNEDAVGKSLETDGRSVLTRIGQTHKGALDPNGSLIAGLTSMDKALSDEKVRSSTLADRVEELEKDNKSLSEAIKGASDNYTAQVTALNERIGQLEKQNGDLMGQKEKQLTDLQAQLESGTQEMNKLRTDTTRDIRERDLLIARNQNAIETLQSEIRATKQSFDINALLTKADGRVLRAIPGSDIVYINLGRSDKIKVGMGFAVYSQSREPSRKLKGKAAIEVAALQDNTAECRVLRTESGQPIIEGDTIVNIAYERSRQPKFLVVGDYDLDFDGVPDPDGVEKVKGMIRQWGGTLVDALDETTDFVIIGRAPDVPQLAPGEPISTVVRALAEDKARDLAKYRDLITQALSMYIPVINQNAFLYLTGYAGNSDWASR